MKKVFIEVFECDCCKFAEYVVKNSIRGHEDDVECKYYTLPGDRAIFEKYGVKLTETDGVLRAAPLVVLSKEGEKQLKVDKVNRIHIQKALNSLLESQTK
jgi:hypothetical protein